MKYRHVDPTLKKPITSFGHSSSLPHSEDLKLRDTPTLKDMVLSETEQRKSTP